MRRPDEHAETIVHTPSPAGRPGRSDDDETDDRTLPEGATPGGPSPEPRADDERTQFVDRSQFLDQRGPDEFPELPDTLHMPEKADAGQGGRDESRESTVVEYIPPAAGDGDAAEAAATPGDRTEAAPGGADGGATTFLGAPGGATILTQPPHRPEPPYRPEADRHERTLRPADSKTISEPAEGSATLAQVGGKAAGAVAPGSDAWKHYEFLDEIAQGGIGRIWRASDMRIRREVAYKELLPAALHEPEAVERFVEEAQVTGQLEHPGIVPVYELGRQENGTPFYTMKFVGGSTFRDAIKACHELPRDSGERRLAFVRLLRNYVAVCNAVGFAHERGVLHRDLKPLNIMLGDFGETLILDWGMAKVLGAPATDEPLPATEPTEPDAPQAPLEHSGDSTLTELELAHSSVSSRQSIPHSQSHVGHSTRRHSVKTDARSAGTETQMGSIMGTPNYMAPEQALGHVDEFDARTDIYSLGAILYEILTGRPPVPKGKITEKLKFIIEGRTPPPTQVDPAIPRPLEAVCLKAMARLKAERYQTALALASDVEAFLADEPVSVYAEPWHTRLRRWAKRHRTAVTTTAAVAVVLVAGWAAWSIVDTRRIGGIEHSVRGSIVQARNAVTAGELDRANDVLQEAFGLASAEPELASLAAGVEAQITHVGQLRTERTRQVVQENIAAADAAIQTNADYAAARTLLTEARALAGREQGLAALQAELTERLRTVELTMATAKEFEDAQQNYERFKELADRARLYGSALRAESPQQDAAAAKEAALEALVLFDLNRPTPLDPPPPHLTPAQITVLRDGGYELSYILARAEVTLAWNVQGEQRRKVGEQALAWIQRAKSYGIQTRSLLMREAWILGWLGREEERGRVATAASELTPTSALDSYLIAETYRQEGFYAEALEWYERALQIDPAHFWSMHLAGLCHLQRGDARTAIFSYTGCMGLEPEFPWNYALRGEAWGLLGRYDEALADFETALASRHPIADSRLEMGVYLNRGAVLVDQSEHEKRPELFDSAIADFRRAADLRPDRADPHLALAAAYHRRGKQVHKEQGPIEAAKWYQQSVVEATAAAARAPITSSAYLLRGDVHNRLGESATAISDFRRAAELATSARERAQADFELGRVYHDQKDYQPALESYNSAIENNPEVAEAWYLRAETLKKLNRHRDAALDFMKFIDVVKSQPEPAALSEFDRAVREAMLATAYRWRGEWEAAQGSYRDAMPDYTRSVELDPNSSELLMRRGWAYALKSFELAEADFTDAIRLAPDDADARAGRGYARVMQGKYDAAVVDADRAATLAPEQIRGGDPQGWQLLFNPAGIYAEAAGRVLKDRALDPPKRAPRADEFARRAIELLKQAEQAAKSAGKHQEFLINLRADPALDPIRERPEFEDAWGAAAG
ncbi:MAG TPA: tetratricopeptide repeat protein [Planctomycetaceae bacterium]|nr:tetratricopeptide repeat protein [Planctomycetaceae bacterium]